MSDTTLTALLQQIDTPAGDYARLDRYYDGKSPLSFLAPEAAALLGDRLRRLSVNIPRLLVDSVAERLRVTGFTGADVWTDWLASDLDQTSHTAHRDALVLGDSYAVVWGRSGAPVVSIESARQMTVVTDPGTRRTVAALKRWETATSTEATLFLPDRIERYRANSTGATTAGFKLIDTLDNPLGQVPVVRLSNTARIMDTSGRSEMADILDLSDALTKLLTDMMIASETAARPRRWSTGVELIEDETTGETKVPFDEGTMMLAAEAEGAKFGQLPGADLGGYENAIGVVMRQISAVSGLPEHQLGIGGDNPTSADSIRASEAALTARAEARQQTFGRAWEQVARLMIGVRDGVDPERVDDVRVQWADPATRSQAQEADAVVKLYQSGLLPASYALKRLGYSDAEVDEIRAARSRDAMSSIDLGAVLAR